MSKITQTYVIATTVSFLLMVFAQFVPEPLGSVAGIIGALGCCLFAWTLLHRAQAYNRDERLKRQPAKHEDFLELQQFIAKHGAKARARYAQAVADLKLGDDISMWSQYSLFEVAERVAKRDPAGDGWTIETK